MKMNENEHVTAASSPTVNVTADPQSPSAEEFAISLPLFSEAIIETRSLSVGFSSTLVLDAITVEIPRGGVTALIGPTGSGKSTLLRTFNRMHDRVAGFQHEGDVLMDGTSIFAPGVDLLTLRKNVGMLFQRPNPFPMSIRDNVVAGVKAHRMAKKKQFDALAEEHLTRVGLFDAVKDRLSGSPFSLSGGQQQLLCLARALAVAPTVLLLDEPTSSLDPATTERIESLIETLVPEITVVIVTHNLGQARRVSSRTILLQTGSLVEEGPTSALFDAPSNEVTARYVSGQFA
jgi:phosphate transport system ATP-binding protein